MRKLEVRGDVGISGDIFISLPRKISRGIYLFRDSAASNTGGTSWGLEFKDDIDNNNYLLSLKAAGSLALTVNRYSNIGIGTTSPDEKLTVKGKIHSEEVRVDLTVPAPDYVFEKEYDLKGLDELESYIEANKHLPEIPSANDFKHKGILIGDMNMLLLKKVEELTLYIISQHKEIQELKCEVRNSANEIDK